MSTYSLGKFCCILLLLNSGIARGQKNIVISDSLAANAEKLPVKMGSQGMGKIWKFRFGDYAVVSSKRGWTITSSKSNFWNTKTETNEKEKFSFFLTDKNGDTAKVNAAHNIAKEFFSEITLWQNINIAKNVTMDINAGKNEMIEESNNFSAFITINSDTTETWGLLMNTWKTKEAGERSVAYLTDGTRSIEIVPASSNKNGDDNRALPALGYELVEQGHALAAVQYYGGGNLGMNKNIVWLGNMNDARLKLILSAAMTSLLEIKVTTPTQ